MLNWQLMRSPYNWAIVFLMVAIAGYGLALIFPAPANSAE